MQVRQLGRWGDMLALGTDIKLNAQILTYARSKGVFAGTSLRGAVVQADQSGDHAMYGANVNRREILDGKVPDSASARPLLRNIAKYAREAKRQG